MNLYAYGLDFTINTNGFFFNITYSNIWKFSACHLSDWQYFNITQENLTENIFYYHLDL